MDRFRIVITYDITTILVSLTETILFDGNKLSPVLLNSSQWLTFVEWSQEQEKWDSQPCQELTKVNSRTRIVLTLPSSCSHFALFQLWISCHITYVKELFQYLIFLLFPPFIIFPHAFHPQRMQAKYKLQFCTYKLMQSDSS